MSLTCFPGSSCASIVITLIPSASAASSTLFDNVTKYGLFNVDTEKPIVISPESSASPASPSDAGLSVEHPAINSTAANTAIALKNVFILFFIIIPPFFYYYSDLLSNITANKMIAPFTIC